MLGHFKSLIGSKSQAEGCIAGQKIEEALTLYSHYFEDIESRVNRPKRVNDETNHDEVPERSSMFPRQGKVVGGFITFALTHLEKTQAHRYVLLNCASAKPFIDEFRQHIKRSSRGRKPSITEVEKRINREFTDWFPKRIMNPDIEDTISDDIKFLAQGPAPYARRFTAYNINGFKFRTLSREQGLKTQNSGVFLMSNTSCVASSADRNARQADLPYYGKLEDIIELNYYGKFRVVLFKCKWADATRDRGFKRDVWNFNCVNFSKLFTLVIVRIMILILKHHKQIWFSMLMMKQIKNGV